MTDDRRAPRRDGRQCPPWCTINHADALSGACAGAAPGAVPNLAVWANAIIDDDGRPMVAVTGLGGHAQAPAWNGEGLAGIIELLAGLTPDEHRRLAAGVRASAELAAGA